MAVSAPVAVPAWVVASFATLGRIALLLAFAATLIVGLTSLTTNWRYRQSMRTIELDANRTKDSPLSRNEKNDALHIASPPPIPYRLPILGHAVALLDKAPGAYWKSLLQWFPRTAGACTILLGGQTTHVLFSPVAIQALIKQRQLSRHSFNAQIVVNALGLSQAESDAYASIHDTTKIGGRTPYEHQEYINHTFLLRADGVRELTARFCDRLHAILKSPSSLEHEPHTFSTNTNSGSNIGMYSWLRPRMFDASTRALMGDTLLEIYPELRNDFFLFDNAVLTLFFGLPRLLAPTAHAIRDKTVDGMLRYHEHLQALNPSPTVQDPEGPVDWEPFYGSRLNRARQLYYDTRGLGLRARAGLDLGLIFGLSSNAIPATAWMLMHILRPDADPTLRPRVMAELHSTVGADGMPEVSKLVGLPLLQSIFQETMRVYVDILLTRDLAEDLVLPVDEQGRQCRFARNSIIMAPSWPSHLGTEAWSGPAASEFYPERFLTSDPTTGQPMFSVTGTSGKLFPFGGGSTMCPGRVFAKQEVLGAVAMVLLFFDIQVDGFLDEHGRPTQQFPPVRKAFPGSAVCVPAGDLAVRIQPVA